MKLPWTLVLLADGFDEAHVTSLVQELRSDGLPVRLVGLVDGPGKGAHGLRLLPDVTLETMGSDPVGIIVLPAGLDAIARLRADPRVEDLLGSGRAVAFPCDSLEALGSKDPLSSWPVPSQDGLVRPALLLQRENEGGAGFARVIKHYLYDDEPVLNMTR